LIASHKSGRYSRLIEIDPKYCDVIVRRFIAFTAAPVILDGDGRSFAQIEVARRQAATI
jgi:hypothetical protein